LRLKVHDAARAPYTSRMPVAFDALPDDGDALKHLLLNGVEAFAYLRAVLECIAEHPISRIDELLPWNLELARGQGLRQAA
jgi:hypothetical protein